MYQLHIAEKHISSWSLRAWLLLRVLGIPFTETLHRYQTDLAAQRRAWASFSPTAKVPVLVDGDTVVWDSLAIAEYVAESCPEVWPQDKVARAWARSAAAEMHSGFGRLRSMCSFRLDETAKPVVDTELQTELMRLDALWQQGLQRFGGPFLAGAAFSVVDAFYAPVAVRLQSYQLIDDLHGAAADYACHLLALPAMQQWQAEAAEQKA